MTGGGEAPQTRPFLFPVKPAVIFKVIFGVISLVVGESTDIIGARDSEAPPDSGPSPP